MFRGGDAHCRESKSWLRVSASVNDGYNAKVFSSTRPTVIAREVTVWELFDIAEFTASGCD